MIGAPVAHELEPIAARGWPAAFSERLGDWRLHASSGYSGRINACWPLGAPGMPLAKAIGEVEAWYRTQGLPPLFKIVDGDAPALTAALVVLGYQARTPTLAMVGPANGAAHSDVRVSSDLDDDFAAVFAAAQGHAADAQERLAALGRIPLPRIFALTGPGAPAAIGACAVEGEWAGVLAMRTDAGHRRQGLARRILVTLLATARQAGAKRAWLQVEAENAGAIALYVASGFTEAYRYRYWNNP